jgi:hypothetical protein
LFVSAWESKDTASYSEFKKLVVELRNEIENERNQHNKNMVTKKSTLNYLFVRIKKEWTFTLLPLAVCAYIIITCHIKAMQIPCLFAWCKADEINFIIETLAFGYIASFLVYLLTVLIPQSRKTKFVMPDFVEDFSSIKEEFEDLLVKITGERLSDQTADLMFEHFAKKDYDSVGDDELVEVPEAIINWHKKVYLLLSNILSKYEQYLDIDEYKRLSQIRLSFLFSETLKHEKDTIALSYTKKTTKNLLIKDMINNYKEIDVLYNELSSVYGYDFQ